MEYSTWYSALTTIYLCISALKTYNASSLCSLYGVPVHQKGVRLIPANTSHWTNVGSRLANRLRRRPNIEPTLVQWFVFAGMSHKSGTYRCYRCGFWLLKYSWHVLVPLGWGWRGYILSSQQRSLWGRGLVVLHVRGRRLVWPVSEVIRVVQLVKLGLIARGQRRGVLRFSSVGWGWRDTCEVIRDAIPESHGVRPVDTHVYCNKIMVLLPLNVSSSKINLNCPSLHYIHSLTL